MLLPKEVDEAVYVIPDSSGHRLALRRTPDGKYLQTIPVQQPQEIAVHAKTGEIYVLCFRRNAFDGVEHKGELTLIKFGAFDNPVERKPGTRGGDVRRSGRPQAATCQPRRCR